MPCHQLSLSLSLSLSLTTHTHTHTHTQHIHVRAHYPLSSYGGLNALQAIARDSGTVFAAGVSTAGIFNWVSQNRYVTDTGTPLYDGDVQPTFPSVWRQLQTGPLPHLASPNWVNHVQRHLETAFASSPVVGAPPAFGPNATRTNGGDSATPPSGFTAPLMIIQGDADEVRMGVNERIDERMIG